MSSLLKEAIVDAKALRESALKSAETSIIEKYSDEVKSALNSLLEQEELAPEGGAAGTDTSGWVVAAMAPFSPTAAETDVPGSGARPPASAPSCDAQARWSRSCDDTV